MIISRREEKFAQIVRALKRRGRRLLWISEGDAAVGTAWTPGPGTFLHVTWDSIEHIAFELRDKNGIRIVGWTVERDIDPLGVWRDAVDVIDLIPAREHGLRVHFDGLMADLEALDPNKDSIDS